MPNSRTCDAICWNGLLEWCRNAPSVHTLKPAENPLFLRVWCGRRDSNPHSEEGDFKSSVSRAFSMSLPTVSRFVALLHINTLAGLSECRGGSRGVRKPGWGGNRIASRTHGQRA